MSLLLPRVACASLRVRVSAHAKRVCVSAQDRRARLHERAGGCMSAWQGARARERAGARVLACLRMHCAREHARAHA
eukprot:4617769-Pleurochrysis_carterae.AAC.1